MEKKQVLRGALRSASQLLSRLDRRTTKNYVEVQGFPKKDARFSKLQNIPDLLSDEKEGKIMENIDFTYFAIWRLLWETLYQMCCSPTCRDGLQWIGIEHNF